MSKDEKLFQKIRNNPKSVSFEDLDKVLRHFGFKCRQPSGGSSHYVYTYGSCILTVPYKRPHLKEHYVRAALNCIEQIVLDDD